MTCATLEEWEGGAVSVGKSSTLARLGQADWHWPAGLPGISCLLLPEVSRIALGLLLVPMAALITVIT